MVRMREWLQGVEAASLQGDPVLAQAAAARFDALATPAQRMALVREVVTTRARELTLAYRNVVMVAAGYKSRTGADGDEVHPEPCVIFLVKRKWDAQPAAQRHQTLPRYLLTFGSEAGERVLYAVPTDVQPAHWFAGGSVRSGSCVIVEDAQFSLPGTLTCAVELRAAGGDEAQVFALSAMHVLSPVPAQPLPAAGAAWRGLGTGAAVGGCSSRWGGHLDELRGSAFDTQLAQVDDAAWFRAAFEGLELSTAQPYVASPGVFDELAASMRFQILAPDNFPGHGAAARDPMLAQFLMMNGGAMPLGYQLRRSGDALTFELRHRELILLRVLDDCPAPEGGDSGSPVISWWPDGSLVLVGMFIGSGNGPERERLVHVNPAWKLFDPTNWSRLPEATLKLTPSFSMP